MFFEEKSPFDSNFGKMPSMKAKFRKKEDIYFFDFEGDLDFQTVDKLRFFWSQKALRQKKIVFNLKDLSFVGSQGVNVFSETVEVANRDNYLKICCASPEFSKFFDSRGMRCLLFESEGEAISSFFNSEEENFVKNESLLGAEK